MPLANVGAAMGLVVLPALLGPLYWSRGTLAGAISSLTIGLLFMLLTLDAELAALLLPHTEYLSYPAISGLLLSAAAYVGVSWFTRPVPYRRQVQYHGYLSRVLYPSSTDDTPTEMPTSRKSVPS